MNNYFNVGFKWIGIVGPLVDYIDVLPDRINGIDTYESLEWVDVDEGYQILSPTINLLVDNDIVTGRVLVAYIYKDTRPKGSFIIRSNGAFILNDYLIDNCNVPETVVTRGGYTSYSDFKSLLNMYIERDMKLKNNPEELFSLVDKLI